MCSSDLSRMASVAPSALRDRDPEGATEAMRSHLEDVSDNLLGRH